MWKTLLVDDEEAICRLLKAVLELGDFKITTATSARNAIEVLHTQTFDAVVTDLRMETQFAGFDVVTYARGLTPRPVTVVVTAFPVPPAEWRKAGADALFTKGSDTLQLATRLEGLLKAKTGSMPTSTHHL